uniref:Uncharacterized protein n=1 Tax=Amphimedon queenslandica TaxID=400682 RepID=A0A1X7V8R3_AMPQE
MFASQTSFLATPKMVAKSKAQVVSIFGQQCSAASTWRCLGSLVVTTASDAKSTTYKKKNNIITAAIKMKSQVD